MSNTGCVQLHMPFGVQLSGSAIATPGLTFDPMRAFLGQLNGVLLPFMPIFKIVGFAKDVVDALNSIPDCITQLSPKPLIEKMVKVAQDIEQLLEVLPQASVPVMLRDLLGAMITFLSGILSQLTGLQQGLTITLRVETAANAVQDSNPDAYAELNGIVVASLADQETVMNTLDAQSCAFNELAKTFAAVAALINAPIPPLLPCFNFSAGGSVAPQLAALNAAIAAITAAIDVLEALGDALGGASEPLPPC